jgi:predicted ATPase/DNA-binding SARP family transcriptional activator
VRIYLLGDFRLEVAGQPVALSTRKAESLLAYLALHPEGIGHSREKLAALFWGDSPDADARRSLRVALTGLRKAFGADPFSGDRELLGLAPETALWVDAQAFQAQAARFLAGGEDALAEECAALYRGDLLADLYDDWLSLPRNHLRSRFQEALRVLADRQRGRGDYATAAATARRLLDLDPADEVAHQQIIFCCLAQGDRSAARQQYEACVRALRAELDAPPSAETAALLGWIQEAPPAHSTSAARRGNVPLPLTRLIGRQTDFAALTTILQPAPRSRVGSGARGEGRLVTLTGPGGNGKTRLAQEIGLALANRFRDGAWWVDLVPLTAAALIAGAIMRVFGLPDTPEQSPEDALIEHLRQGQALLILDNCEHLVGGAAALVARLVSHCPATRIIATSREALGVPGEQVYPLAPLPVPDTDHDLSLAALSDIPAIALFVDRAASHEPGFRLTPKNGEVITSICRRLDGIPLAIELAAARVSLLSVEQIAERLDDRFRLLRSNVRSALPRQQTLQALMDWSYDLLTPAEQALFRGLAVFAGGWTLTAAEAVCVDRPAGEEVLDLLGRLVDKSLIVVHQTADGVRYGFLETILAYARRRLADPAEAEAVAAAHLAHFLALAEHAEPQLRGPEMFDWLARLEREHDNLRGALAWALAPDADAPRCLAGLRMAAVLELFWYMRGHGRAGRRWLAEALTRAPADAPPAVIARAHAAAGTMAWLLGDFDAATAHHATALAGYRALGDGRGAAWALGNLGVCANEQGDHGAALAMYAEAAELARSAGAAWERALILNNWSAALIDLGCPDDAIPLLETSARTLREVGDEWAASHPMLNLVEIAIQRGEYDRAGRLLADMAALADRLGVASLTAAVRLRQGAFHLRQGQPAAATGYYRASLGGYIELADRAEALHALEGLALALADLGANHQAARLLAAADAGRASLGTARQPAEALAIAHCLAQLRERLGDDALAAIQAAGRHLTLENASAEALSARSI